MRGRTRTVVIYLLASLQIACFVAAVTLIFLAAPASGSAVGPGSGAILALLLPCLTFPVFGAIMLVRRPENRVGWMCLLVGGIQFVSVFQIAYAAYGVTGPGGLPHAAIVGASSSWVPQVGILGTFFLLLFPDGALPSPRWRPVAWTAAFAIVALTLDQVFATRTVVWFKGTDNPLLAHGALLRSLDGIAPFLTGLLFASIVASVLSLFMRFRGATREVKAKVKWIAYAGAIFFVVLVVSSIAWQDPARHPSLVVAMLQDSIGIGIGAIPAAALFAVLRYRLYDIDRIVSRTLSYALITAVLGGGYALIVVAPATLLGSERTPAPLVAAAVLLMAASFGPLRRSAQSLIDRRFNRARTDAARTVEVFAHRLRDEIDIDTLRAELTGVVTQALQPAHTSLWTPTSNGERQATRT